MPDTVFHSLPKIGHPVQQGVMPLIMVQDDIAGEVAKALKSSIVTPSEPGNHN